jgi:hypothetical protein
VAIIQRFGAALNLNVHVHALVLDGVHVVEGGMLRFHDAMPPTDDEMDRLLGAIDRRVHRLLARRGVRDDLGEGSAANPCQERGARAGRHLPAPRCRDGGRSGSGRARRCAGVGRRRNCLRWRHRAADRVTLTFLEVRLITLAEGIVNELHVGFKAG